MCAEEEKLVAGDQGIVAGAAVKGIGFRAAGKSVISAIAVKNVAAGTANNQIGIVTTIKCVVSGSTRDAVVAGKPGIGVISSEQVHIIRSGCPRQDVVTCCRTGRAECVLDIVDSEPPVGGSGV